MSAEAPGTLAPGIYYDVKAGEYHAIDALSATRLKAICLDSPAHARYRMREDKEEYDLGTAAHAILLEGIDAVTIIDANDWRTNAAKDARDAARAAGKIPLLAKVKAGVDAMTQATRRQLDAIDSLLFADGSPEVTLVWQEGELWCKARLDWLSTDADYIDDYKTTSASANPEIVSRTMFGNGWDIQAAWYLRGLKVLMDVDAQFRFVVQETYAPYALSVVALGPDAMCLAEKKILYGLDTWRECLRTHVYPAYPPQICYAELPAWHESQWLEKEMR